MGDDPSGRLPFSGPASMEKPTAARAGGSSSTSHASGRRTRPDLDLPFPSCRSTTSCSIAASRRSSGVSTTTNAFRRLLRVPSPTRGASRSSAPASRSSIIVSVPRSWPSSTFCGPTDRCGRRSTRCLASCSRRPARGAAVSSSASANACEAQDERRSRALKEKSPPATRHRGPRTHGR
jgi:hypothetical protein